MIYVMDVTKNFGMAKKQKTVLDKVSWRVDNGSVTGLFGRSGSGKTAALRIITGVQNASEGRVIIDSQDISTDILEARKLFGYVPASTDQFLGLTGEEYLSFITDIYQVDPEERERFLEEYIPKLKLEEHFNEKMFSYSKSVYKKTMLLGAMVYQPNNLILDNIREGLDPPDHELVKKILKEYAGKGRAVLLADNRLSMAEDLCSHIVYLTKGRVKIQGTLASVLEKFQDAASLEVIELMLNDELDEFGGKHA